MNQSDSRNETDPLDSNENQALHPLDGLGRRRAWTVSVIFHTLLFLLLACFVLPPQIRRQALVFQQPSGNDAMLDFAASAVALQPEAIDGAEELPVEVASLKLDPVELDPLPVFDISEEMELDLDKSDPDLSGPLDASRSNRRRGRETPWTEREASTTDSISTVNGVVEAFGPIEKAIRKELAQGDTLVVWLLDASISLQLNRQAMASRLAEFQASMGLANRRDGLRQADQSHRLFNSVVAFGRGVTEIQGPTLTGLRAAEQIARLPNDSSGVERTMSAVNEVVGWYREKHHRRERMLIVLLTDESGDDGLAVESTIANCRYNGVGVHVIGPTAVMGLQEGYQLWTSHAYAKPYKFLLKVNRGPETCLPERALMPYWHETQVSAWRPDVRPADSIPWHGGAYRDGLLSGFGPYTLTRLALQTGGSYTIFDQGRESRYDRETLRDYLPEYGSLDEYQASMEGRPLRRFVSTTATVTLRESDMFAPLQMMFFGVRDKQYPFTPRSSYMSPSRFRRQLQQVLSREMQRAQAAASQIEQLLANFPAKDLEYDYAREESLRWRAWFDLNRGRLLAASVRYNEYVAVCAELLDRETPLGSEINEVVFLPGRQYRVATSESRSREAVELLQRCSERHASTQWADLAAWELQTDFGIRVSSRAIPKPPPPSNVRMGFSGVSSGLRSTATMGGGGGGQSFSFPSL